MTHLDGERGARICIPARGELERVSVVRHLLKVREPFVVHDWVAVYVVVVHAWSSVW